MRGSAGKGDLISEHSVEARFALTRLSTYLAVLTYLTIPILSARSSHRIYIASIHSFRILFLRFDHHPAILTILSVEPNLSLSISLQFGFTFCVCAHLVGGLFWGSFCFGVFQCSFCFCTSSEIGDFCLFFFIFFSEAVCFLLFVNLFNIGILLWSESFMKRRQVRPTLRVGSIIDTCRPADDNRKWCEEAFVRCTPTHLVEED